MIFGKIFGATWFSECSSDYYFGVHYNPTLNKIVRITNQDKVNVNVFLKEVKWKVFFMYMHFQGYCWTIDEIKEMVELVANESFFDFQGHWGIK
jgi:hypothetical protein